MRKRDGAVAGLVVLKYLYNKRGGVVAGLVFQKYLVKLAEL